ncbi:hypothetical protein ACR34G_02325 [Mycoplasma sp. 480]|uniref:hypothetical protein n=1 Tax=Mycoplasma sp. 480 TaxID=3440155 RepID=UPI003F51ABCC
MSRTERDTLIKQAIENLKNKDVFNLPEIMERNEKGSWKRMQECMKNLSKL